MREVHHRIKNQYEYNQGTTFLQHAEKITHLQQSHSRRGDEGLPLDNLFDKLYIKKIYRELSVKNYLDSLISDIICSSPNRGIVSIEADIEDHIMNVNILTPLGIIINELITNAMKHAFKNMENGLISITAAFNEGTGSITVKDNGAGIPDSVYTGGTSGFGLNLVRMIVEQINGTLRIENKGGTVIVVEFELHP